MRTHISEKRARLLVGKEAVSVNKQLYRSLLQSEDMIGLLQESDTIIVEAFLNVLILGRALGLKSLQQEFEAEKLELSFDQEVLKFVEETDYLVQKVFYESYAREFTAEVRESLADAMIQVSDYARTEGYTPEQTEKLFREVLKSKGFSPATARNLKTVFDTGLHLSYNGIRYNRAKGSPAVWGFRYLTAGDEKVRETHIAQQGATLPKEDPFWEVWNPPAGWNCRCTLEILFEEKKIVEPDRTVSPDPGFEGNKFGTLRGY